MSGPSSGPSGTRVSPTANTTHNPSDDQATNEPGNEAAVTAAKGAAQDGSLLHRRHRPRRSGGFLLLQTAPAPPPPHPPPMELDTARDVKGKRKAEEGDLFVPKRASAHQRHRQKASLGGSPLATEVVNVHSSENSDGVGASERGKRALEPANAKRSLRSSFNINGTSAGLATGSIPELQPHRRSAIGPDTEAAQIVNLALNLSESRRRNFSSGGYLLPRDFIGTRRVVSSGQAMLGLPDSASGGSLRQELQHQRQVSRNVSPRSGRSGRSLSTKGTASSSSPSQNEHIGHRHSTLLPDFTAGVAEDFVFDASDATFSRAEKARVTIGLMYEYRRLLQYLPPIPASSKSKSATSKDLAKYQADPSTSLGRTYNPLQYIRNRKVRFRERRPLDPEAAGWKDLDRVRSWVDTIANEREDGLHRIDRRFPLPSLDAISGDHSLDDRLPISNVPNPAGSQNKRVGRPRMDWDFASWDLLADAYWLNQDDNLDHIEGPSGNKIMAGHPNRNYYTSRTSIESSRSSVGRSESVFREHASPDRVRALAGHSRKDSKDRGRRSLDMHEPRSPASEDNGSRDRKSRWAKKLVRSRSSSDSDDSLRESRRNQKRGRDYAGSHEKLESAALEKQMMEMLAREAEASRPMDQKPGEETYARANPDPKLDRGIRDGITQQDVIRRPKAPQRMKTDMPVTARHLISNRASLDEERFPHRRMSSGDLDMTEPNSPTAPGNVPSIAINLSPPASPPSAVSSPRKTLTARVGSSRRDRSRSVDRRATGEIDTDTSGMTSLSRQTTNQSQLVNLLRKEKYIGTSNGSFTPVKNEAADNKHSPIDSHPVKSMNNANGSDSRLRGLFKGGRIAELVGNEVSRVGDRIWRKDNNHVSGVTSPASSYAASEDSDMDEGDMSGLDDSPENDLSRATTRDGGSLSKVSTNSEKPRYYMSNLPSFRSSNNRDQQHLSTTNTPPDHDHITRQQLAQRERGRSSRFDRLAPPKIDMRGVSASSSRESSPVRSQPQPRIIKGSRHSSSSPSDRRVRVSDRKLNAMLEIPGKLGWRAPPPTGLTGLESKARESPQPSDSTGERQWSISDRGVSSVGGTINKRDIARVRALLLSSGVKASEITRRAEEIPEKPAPLLQELECIFKGSIPRVPRSQEFSLAARILISNIETRSQRLRDDTDHFMNATVAKLHEEIKAIDEHVTYELTPLVRSSADNADAFSEELTTTHTLAIKQLNDSVNVVLRRRRRQSRSVGRIGWAMVEWTLLGIMWIVWLVVVIIRLLRGIVGGLVKGMRWLFWL